MIREEIAVRERFENGGGEDGCAEAFRRPDEALEAREDRMDG